MKVSELIEKLKQLDENADIKIAELSHDRYGETYGIAINGETIISNYFGHEYPSW